MVTTTQPSAEELQQLQRTVEMFEAITESQPDDYQSLEILKEAYGKLGRQTDVRRVALKLASAYRQVGQVSQAILEYEGLLQSNPDDTETRAALAELEATTSQFRAPSEEPSRAKDSKPKPASPTTTVGTEAPPPVVKSRDPLDGENALVEVLLSDKTLTRQSVTPLLEQLKTEREASIKAGQPLTLVQLLVDNQLVKPDELFGIVAAKSAKPYLPLSYYDVDRDTALLVPREVCFRYCLVPFDLISRSVLVATANPFDEAARTELESLLDYNIFWYLSPPAEIIAALRRIHGLDSRTATSGVR